MSGRELKFVLNFFNPVTSVLDSNSFEGLDEDMLIEILEKNKLVRRFSKKLSSSPLFKEKLLSDFPKLRNITDEQEANQKKEINEFIRISQKLSNQDIHLLLIKSGGEFPYESSNIDCLIEPRKLAPATYLLLEEGYREYPEVREPHKFLFSRKAAPKELLLHVHTRVEWEAIEFANPKELRTRARVFLNQDTGALIPSAEDSILITIAHYFFEDHELKISDLLKIWSLASAEKLNWDYMFSQAYKLGWDSALFLNLKIINEMSLNFFGEKLFQEQNRKSNLTWLFSKIITYQCDGTSKIPYFVSGIFLFQKVAKNYSYRFNDKLRQMIYVFSDVLRRRVRGYVDVQRIVVPKV